MFVSIKRRKNGSGELAQQQKALAALWFSATNLPDRQPPTSSPMRGQHPLQIFVQIPTTSAYPHRYTHIHMNKKKVKRKRR